MATVAETPEEKVGAIWASPSSEDAPPAVLTLPGGQRIELHEGHYVLGRHLENDIVLNDTNVSRKHAEFVCAAGEVMVHDLGSTNGTKVNGVVVHGEQLLQHGDVINFGTAQVTFEAS
jgi:pSer/pThr/pTyr-binding forkhead associated (FHA) protein